METSANMTGFITGRPESAALSTAAEDELSQSGSSVMLSSRTLLSTKHIGTYSPLVRAMISSAVKATSPFPRIWEINREPLVAFTELRALTMETTTPSNLNSTSVSGSKPACTLISTGIVT